MERRVPSLPTSEWEARLRSADIPHAPILTVSGLLDHPQDLAQNAAEFGPVVADRYLVSTT
jgi:crotonobetainyl-CoA:carnitine CoA-transferase CaiB-like acyl-CoA transferase